MEFEVKKRIFKLHDHECRLWVTHQIIRVKDGRELLRLVCFEVSELLSGNHLLLQPPLFLNSFETIRESLADQYSLEMIELLSLFAGLRKVAKRIVVWEKVIAPDELYQISRFVSQRYRRYGCLHILKNASEEMARELADCGFIQIDGTAIWVGGGLSGKVRGKLRVRYELK